jgi:hypothetical protein
MVLGDGLQTPVAELFGQVVLRSARGRGTPPVDIMKISRSTIAGIVAIRQQ